MQNIILIETATQVCSVALSVNGKIIEIVEESAQNIHASKLTLFVDEVMRNSCLPYKELDAVAISKGPGSYTGLRIGVSSAKGLCYALDTPLIAIETLKMMAAGFMVQNPNYRGLICPMIDARRMEVYTSLFDNCLNVIEPTAAKIINEESFKHELAQQKITFIGDGAAKCADVLAHEHACFSNENFNSAAYMNDLAIKAFQLKNFEDVAYFEPFYLKDFVVTAPKNKIV